VDGKLQNQAVATLRCEEEAASLLFLGRFDTGFFSEFFVRNVRQFFRGQGCQGAELTSRGRERASTYGYTHTYHLSLHPDGVFLRFY